MNVTRILLLNFFLMLSMVVAQAQDILSRLPAIPQDACTADPERQQVFEDKITGLIHEINKSIRGMKEQARPEEEKAREQAEQMLLQQGLTPEEVNKMKDKNLSKDEKQAMADKMMQQYTNMSMAEVNQMKTMTPEGKQAYTEAYAAEAQAAAQAEGRNNSGADPVAKNYADLLMEQNLQYQNIKERERKVMNKYRLVDEDAEGLRMVSEMNNLMAEMNRLVGGGGEGGWNADDKKIWDADRAALNQLKRSYCAHMSALYQTALNGHLADLHASYSEYLKLEETSGRVDNTVISLGTQNATGRITYHEWVITYLEKLKEIYRYYPVER